MISPVMAGAGGGTEGLGVSISADRALGSRFPDCLPSCDSSMATRQPCVNTDTGHPVTPPRVDGTHQFVTASC